MRREIFAVAAALFATAAVAQLPPNAFLVRPAHTPNALVQQAQQNPIVMDRYMRHFQMSRDEVVRYLGSLRVETVTEDTYYEVFNVPSKTGEIRSKRLLLKKGTKIFVDNAGRAVIHAECGNPMLRTDEASVAQPAMAMGGAAGPVSIEVPMPESITTDVGLITPTAPVYPDVIFETPQPDQGIITTENQGGAPFVGGALGLLPALFLGLNTGGGGVIPEPGTILALGTGCALLVFRLRRRPR